MIKKNHNEVTKTYFQKLLLFIDTSIINAGEDNENKQKILISNLLSIKDSIMAELIKDNQVDAFNKLLIEEKESLKKNQKTKEKEKEKYSSLEKQSENDQSVSGR